MKEKSAPNVKKAERFAATSVRLRTAEPGTSGDRDRASIRTKAHSIKTEAANSPSVDTEPQPKSAARIERVDEQEQASGHGDRAGRVEAFAPAAVASVDGQEDSRHRDEKNADRNVDEEDAVPTWAAG